MRKLIVIGIGPGDPELLTLQATRALGEVDVFLIPSKGEEKAELRRTRLDICRRFAGERPQSFVELEIPKRRKSADYQADVDEWHRGIADAYGKALAELPHGGTAGLLVWGDPSLYDSTLRILERLSADGVAFDYEIVPGITSVQLLAARHRIALNRIGEPVLLTPARRLAEGFPDDVDTAVVLLDGEQTFQKIDGEKFDIYWGAYLGMPDEMLVSGKLSEVAAQIAERREQARAKKGWIMDVYLLRRRLGD